MTQAVRTVSRQLVRFAILWFVDALCVALAALLVPGVWFGATDTARWTVAIAAAFLLSITNLLIRPIVLMIARPLGFFVVFAVGFLVNGFALLITSRLLPEFHVDGLLAAIVAGIVFAAVNVLLTGILDVEEDGSVYQNLIERLAARDRPPRDQLPGRGLVVLEIDGLSYQQMNRALAQKRLPTVRRMIEEEGYVVTRYDCGLPSQTSACQAGLMFGDNYDIPAFRWLDKDAGRLYQSGKDAEAINARYSHRSGLLRGGSSIVNMMAGDAAKAMLTAASIRTSDPTEARRRAQDIYLLMLNPYFLMRSVALLFAEAAREVWQAWQQKRANVWPRLNRMAHLYPLVRGATVVFVRDLMRHLVIFDVIRGTPAIYATWPGYDEVAHHSGPFTSDAMGTLRGYDEVIEKVGAAMRDKAPIHYDLVILSDHGQSFGPTFKQRYGLTLKEFIEQRLPGGTTVAQAVGGDTGVTTLMGVAGELGQMQDQGVGGAAGRSVMRQGQKALAKGIEAQETDLETGRAQVTAYGSGNLAMVYLDLLPRKITLRELDEAYPGLVEALVQHEGIGFVGGFQDDGTPIVLGKGGQRDLVTGVVTGLDPLSPYANPDPSGVGHATPDFRAAQVRYVMDFPHAGDLLVNSTVFADGTVAALEELIGNHGGLGGEQTDAFILHPADMAVPPTANSKDLFPVLNARRELPAPPVAASVAEPHVRTSAWSIGNVLRGIADVGAWAGLAARALVLDRTAYRRVADEERFTGPAIVLALAGAAAISVAREVSVKGGWDVRDALVRFAAWLLGALVVYGAGRALSGQGEFTRTFRALGFASTAHLLGLLALVPALQDVARFPATAVFFVATWLAAAEAHRTRGWRTVLLPLAAVAVAVVAAAIAAMLLRGAELAFSSVLSELGLQP
jgi:uncharacterized membrane protein YvlD (DUF360 family)